MFAHCCSIKAVNSWSYDILQVVVLKVAYQCRS